MPEAGAEPGLTVAAVARRLGVAPATLRTWDRRYGLGPSGHEAGTRRRYAGGDLARLEAMRGLVLRGVAPAEAAAAALRGRGTGSGEPRTDGARTDRAGTQVGVDPSSPPSGVAVVAASHGGRVLALPGAGPDMRGLARAVMSLDEASARAQLVDELRARGVISTWETLLRPLLRALGERWATTGEGVETEHMLAITTVNALREAAAARGPVGATRPVLLASAENEQHSLPLHVLEAALAERGVTARTLGAALPSSALQAAVARIGPAAVLVWSQFASTADPAALDGLPQTRPATVQFVGGPGWTDDRLPRRARVLADLGGAVSELARAVGA